MDNDNVDGACRTGEVLTVVPVEVQDYDATDGSFVCVDFKPTHKTPNFLFVFRYVRECNAYLNVQHFVLSVRLHLYSFSVVEPGPFATRHQGHGFADGDIVTDAEWRGVTAVATARILRPFGYGKSSDTNIDFSSRLAAYSGLLSKETGRCNSSLHT